MGIWAFIGTFGHLAISAFFWAVGGFGICLFGHVVTWAFGYLGNWAFGQMGIW